MPFSTYSNSVFAFYVSAPLTDPHSVPSSLLKFFIPVAVTVTAEIYFSATYNFQIEQLIPQFKLSANRSEVRTCLEAVVWGLASKFTGPELVRLW
jgi:hypothetical protein